MRAKRVVADIMKPNPVTVTPRNAIRTAINLIREGGYRRLPVVDRGRLVGIITDRDFRRAANSPLVVREQWYDNFILDHILQADVSPSDHHRTLRFVLRESRRRVLPG